MNKHDGILIGIILIITLSFFLVFKLTEDKSINSALVYYDDNLVLAIDLSLEEQEYVVKGYNGDVTLVAGNGQIKVEQENSPLHLCSKQGYISKSYESIVCLPNKIVIELAKEDNEYDAIVK